MSTARTRVVAVAAAVLVALSVASGQVVAQGQADGHLGRILDAGMIRMSTDPAFPPQSELVDGEFVGFDIDVGSEIADRLGVGVTFETPAWALVTAGSWGDRWDMSVGTMTITGAREEVIDFTRPYYYRTAQMAAHADLGYEGPDDLAGQAVCTGEATTYLDWMGGTLDFGSASPLTSAPEGSTVVTRLTDLDCAQEWALGLQEFQGWLTSESTVQTAIDEGLPVVALGEPVFREPLAVAFDGSVEDNDSLVAAVDRIIGSDLTDMAADLAVPPSG